MPGSTAPVVVGMVVFVVTSPLKLVVPTGAPPPVPELASDALLRVTCVALSIDTLLVPTGNDLPELINRPIAKLSVFVTVTVFDPCR